ncbi:MAG: YeeE/YedE thiosulfate transporter family protein, partial [Nitrosospira sp.]
MEYDGGAWSPYLVGALIGVLSMATFYFSNQPIGASTSFARIAGLIGNLFSKGHTESLKFFQETRPQIEWGVMLMIGIILGAFLAAYTGGEITAQWI